MKKKTCNYVVERDGGSVRIVLNGEIDHHNAVSVRGEIDELIYKERPTRLSLDLGDIGFMDSSGLGFIMGRYSLMQKMGGDFVLENPNERVVRIFELAGLGRIVKIERTKKEEM